MTEKINSNRGIIKSSTRVLWGMVIVLALIGIAAVVRRGLSLADVIEPFVNPEYGDFEADFAQYFLLTWLHIIPGFLFMVLGPFQFIRRCLWLRAWLSGPQLWS
jgi:hypothetical protein